MKKNILYVSIAVVVGLIGGWLIFGSNTKDTMAVKETADMSDSHDHSGELMGQMWTCSMHPQIMLPESGDCPICGMDLIPAESGAEGLAPNEIKMTENAMALANIQTTVVGNAMADEGKLSLSGMIAANEENNTVQSSYFEGRIERLNVNYQGQDVSRGQLLATIYAPSLVAAQQELITASSLKESQPALYKAVRNKLKNWKLSESQINRIESSGTVTENFPVYATVSGTVSMVMVAEGDYVKQGQPIVRLNNLNSVWAEFDAYENQISELKQDQKIKIMPNAYPNKVLEGTISFIDPMLNTNQRTVTVRATLQNTDELLKPGMFVTGTVKRQTNSPMQDQLIVPSSAVMWTGERSLVYVKTNPNEPVFEMRQVTIARRVGDSYSIASGLENGDEIVTNGTFTVDAAAQLQGKKSMMNQERKEDDAMMGDSRMSAMQMSFSKAFSTSFNKVIPSYLQIKDALVASDASKASRFAKDAASVLAQIDIANLAEMEQGHLNQSITMLEAISTNDNLENQRAHFIILNENLVAIAMNLDSVSTSLYVQKCPIANDNKGAVWLSTSEEIRNPYFGDVMLNCGSVINTIK